MSRPHPMSWLTLTLAGFFILPIFLFLPSCVSPPPEDQPAHPVDWSASLAELTDEAWQRLVHDSIHLRIKMGLPITELPDLTPEADAEYMAFARSLLERLEQIPTDELDSEDRITHGMLAFDARSILDSEPFYWLNFPYTPYIGGFIVAASHRALAAQSFESDADAENYLGLVEEYAEQIDQIRRHAEGQAERGIYPAKAALPGIVGLFRSYRGRVSQALTVDPGRLTNLPDTTFQAHLAEKIEEKVLPAYDAFLALLESEEYQASAPDAVGLAQYPDGEDFYRHLVRLHTTLDVTPEELHELGVAHVEKLSAQRAAIREELGYSGDQESFETAAKKDPRFLAKTPADVEARYMAYVAEMEPLIPQLFDVTPKAPYGVKRLPPESEAGMTFGYYQAPSPLDETGRYLYNGSQLEERSLLQAGPLIFHELIPGHHFHIARQNENESLPQYRREWFGASAYTEGWANYAASLGAENGLLDDPYERYAWATFDSFFSVRLVVDTGMNLKGWSLEQARAYMKEHLIESETEIATESLRYSTDMPGQALAYKAGFEKFRELRAKTREAAGDDFDLKAFHEAVLSKGAMPLTLLEEHLARHFGWDELEAAR